MTPSSPPNGPSEPLLHDNSNIVTTANSTTASSHNNNDNSFTEMIPDLGCIHRTLRISANTIHLIQFSAGISALSYAITISCHKPDPQHGIASLLELYALLFIGASSLGTMGIYKPNCKRISLVISSRLAPFLAALDCLVAIILFFEKASFLRYIAEKQRALFLSDGLLAFLQQHLNIIPVVLLSLAIVEVMRFYILKRLQENLRQYDTERRNEMLRSHARNLMTLQQQQQQGQRKRGIPSPWGRIRRNLHSPNNEMQAPLLSNPDFESSSLPSSIRDLEGGGGGGLLDSSTISFQQNESLGNSGVSWWEEPTDNSNNRSKDEGGSWIAKVMKKNHRTLSSSKGEGQDDGLVDGDSISSVQFAPIDEQMDIGTTPWDNVSDSEEDKAPDLSWAKEQDE